MMEIKVTKTHIRLGRNHQTSNTHCPVALALRAAGFKDARVGVESAYMNEREFIWERLITLPKNAQKFIREGLIAKRQPMKPFSFKLTEKQVKTLRG